MEQTIFHHMRKVRGITEKSIKRIPEDTSEVIPKGYNNNIKWNFGHIAYVQENLVYGVVGEESGLPIEYKELFSPGTKPADWQIAPPSLSEIASILTEQQSRVEEFLTGRLEEKLTTAFTNSRGLTFNTLGETFLFSFYHEAMHMETIKSIYRLAKSN
ncbi:DinB family protein [Oceanobacillus sp. CF4.6]|uniref:DinB family protein n=1 Tax=Oceanobacillus sp. CF4.6 TaxID=3373080 RepID=UPI003EE73B25